MPESLALQHLSHLRRQVPSSKQRFDFAQSDYLLKPSYVLLTEDTHLLIKGYLKCKAVIAEWDSAIHWQTLSKTKRIILKNRLWFLCVFLSFYFALYGRAATYFLCFAKESRQRKATPVAGLAAPNFPHCTCFWRRSRVAALRTALVSAKTMFRSAAPRGWLHGLCVSGSLNRIACKLLHFYSSVQLQLLKIPIRQTAKLRRCFRLGICLRRYDRR